MDPLQAEDPRRIGGYQVLGRLGAGGMGTVYLGRSPAGLPVAIKVVHAELTDDPNFRTRFAREVTAARAVSGAFTAPVIDADPDARSPWLVTTFLPGMTLYEAVAEYGRLPGDAVYALGASLAEALVSVHRAGVIHRDLKPANVMLAPDGARLIDFGIAHAADAAVVTRTGHLIGSPGFMAPEQAVGRATGPASDIFALGAVLTFAATGEGPFGRGGAPALIYRVVHDPPRLGAITDDELRDLVAACLDKDPRRRPGPALLLERLSARAPGADVLHGTAWLPDNVAGGIAERVPTLVAPSRRRFLAIGGGAVAAVAAGAIVITVRAESGGAQTGPSATPSGPASPTPTPTPTIEPAAPEQRWSHKMKGDPYNGLAAGAGIVAVGDDGGSLYGFDARDGKQLWHQTVGEPGGSADSWRTPVISGRGVYVGWLGDVGALYAYDAASGRERWRYVTHNDARSPFVSGDTVYVGGGDGLVHAVDTATGAVRWRRDIGDVGNSRPYATGGVVYVDSTKALYALDARTGRTRWRHAMAGGAVGPVAAGGLVFCGDAQGELFALTAAEGRQRWRFSGGTSVGLPYVSGGRVYVADGSANMNALDAATGAVRWRAGTQEEEDLGRAAVVDGVVSFTTSAGVWGVDAASGHPLWRGALGGDSRGDTAVANGLVYAACETGKIYAYAAKEA